MDRAQLPRERDRPRPVYDPVRAMVPAILQEFGRQVSIVTHHLETMADRLGVFSLRVEKRAQNQADKEAAWRDLQVQVATFARHAADKVRFDLQGQIIGTTRTHVLEKMPGSFFSTLLEYRFDQRQADGTYFIHRPLTPAFRMMWNAIMTGTVILPASPPGSTEWFDLREEYDFYQVPVPKAFQYDVLPGDASSDWILAPNREHPVLRQLPGTNYMRLKDGQLQALQLVMRASTGGTELKVARSLQLPGLATKTCTWEGNPHSKVIDFAVSDDGTIYILVGQCPEIHVYSRDDQYIDTWFVPPFSDLQAGFPLNIYMGMNGSICVVAYFALYVFAPTGLQIGFARLDTITTIRQKSWPVRITDVQIGPTGTIYVQTHGRLYHLLSANGTYWKTWERLHDRNITAIAVSWHNEVCGLVFNPLGGYEVEMFSAEGEYRRNVKHSLLFPPGSGGAPRMRFNAQGDLVVRTSTDLVTFRC